MKRDIITISENRVAVTGSEVWMTATELAGLFGTTVGAVISAIKAVVKSDVLNDFEVCKYVRLENGNRADVYNLEMVVALAFRFHSHGATRLREYILRTLGTVSKPTAINILLTCPRKTDGHSNEQFFN